MCLVLLVVVYSYKQQAALIVLKGIKVFLFFYLIKGALCAFVVLKLYYHGRYIRDEGNKGNILEAAPRSHLLYHGIFIQRIDIGQIYGALKGILIIIASTVSYPSPQAGYR